VAVPFGAVQLSPDTYNDGWDWCSGYHVSDTSIMGFSHTHLSGTGCGDLLDFLVMAGTGTARIVPGTRENANEGYRSRFNHEDEIISPSYYDPFKRRHRMARRPVVVGLEHLQHVRSRANHSKFHPVAQR
jgi:putative alpha-1,2-mannosidase